MSSSEAGPSRISPKKSKKRAARESDIPSSRKNARTRSPLFDDDGEPSTRPLNVDDPMEALERSEPLPADVNGDSASARNGGDDDDPMEAMERQMTNGHAQVNGGPSTNGRSGADGAYDINGDDDEQIKPTRADEFEQEAEREVEVSKGLDGGATDEGKMKLVHQVRHQVSLDPLVTLIKQIVQADMIRADGPQVALPPNYPYIPIAQHKRKSPPARTYKFELDPFQQVSTSCVERNESVLVSAHTSAGKTVIAEYAIATCLKEGRRVVYTSPIKVNPCSSFEPLGQA